MIWAQPPPPPPLTCNPLYKQGMEESPFQHDLGLRGCALRSQFQLLLHLSFW